MGWTEYAKWQSSEGVKLLEKCGISNEMNVLNFGSSIGEYSIPASIVVGEKCKVVSVEKNIRTTKALHQNILNCNRAIFYNAFENVVWYNFTRNTP